MVHKEDGAVSTPGLDVFEPLKTLRQKCEDKGFVWDEATQTCNPEVLPTLEVTPTPEPPPTAPLAAPALETFTDPETGRASGITLPDGRTFLGLSPEEVQQVATGEQERVARPAGTAPVGTARDLFRDNQRKIALAAGAGQIDFNTITEAEELGINWKEAFLSGTSNVVPAALGAATTLGAIGAAATLPAGGAGGIPAAAIGAVGGAITGFYVGVSNNIKAQKSDLLSGSVKELKGRRQAMMNYISAANANPAGAADFLLSYQIEKSLIRRDYNTLNVEAAEVGTLFGGQDGTSQIIAYDVYFESVEPSLDARMREAILKPDTTRAYLSLEDLE